MGFLGCRACPRWYASATRIASLGTCRDASNTTGPVNWLTLSKKRLQLSSGTPKVHKCAEESEEFRYFWHFPTSRVLNKGLDFPLASPVVVVVKPARHRMKPTFPIAVSSRPCTGGRRLDIKKVKQMPAAHCTLRF